ncbi:MAG: hypothetical protein J7621_21950 [Niastella sp.]|nr:hypothetical protein [Niastella sp.]
MNKRFIVGIVSLLLILLMVYAAQAKLRDYYNFQFGLSESPIIAPFAGVLAWAVPATELIIAAMLVLPRLRLAGLYASFVLMILFTLYIIVMLSFYDDIPCSCGGVLEEMSWGVHIAFNLAFVLGSAWAIMLEKKRRRRPPASITVLLSS